MFLSLPEALGPTRRMASACRRRVVQSTVLVAFAACCRGTPVAPVAAQGPGPRGLTHQASVVPRLHVESNRSVPLARPGAGSHWATGMLMGVAVAFLAPVVGSGADSDERHFDLRVTQYLLLPLAALGAFIGSLFPRD